MLLLEEISIRVSLTQTIFGSDMEKLIAIQDLRKSHLSYSGSRKKLGKNCLSKLSIRRDGDKNGLQFVN